MFTIAMPTRDTLAWILPFGTIKNKTGGFLITRFFLLSGFAIDR